MPDHDEHDEHDEEHEGTPEEDESLVDRMRDSGVGVEDPHIVGDVGPTDVPPGGPDPDHEIGDKDPET